MQIPRMHISTKKRLVLIFKFDIFHIHLSTKIDSKLSLDKLDIR